MHPHDLVEIEFKGSRKEIFSNDDELSLKLGDSVIVKADKGIDLGIVYRLGRLVQMKSHGDGDMRKIVRVASADEVEQSRRNHDIEDEASIICKQKIATLNLKMKLVDVEVQFDGNKMTFFFTSDRRVDFRELVKQLAGHFKTRIELRQIGVRDEARRIGGCGNCGRDLCCTSFIKEFEPITTQYAKDQNLPLNPGKLSGACGRLMCCLGYERDYYQDTLKKFPTIDTCYQTPQHRFIVVKIDVFNEELTLRTSDNEFYQMDLDTFNDGLANESIVMISNRDYRQH